MTDMKTLADKLRQSIAEPVPAKKTVSKKAASGAGGGSVPVKSGKAPDILKEIFAYDTSGHKTMVHARFDAKTAQMLGHFKMATGVENTKIAAFAVRFLFDQHPELKTLIKDYIKNLEL